MRNRKKTKRKKARPFKPCDECGHDKFKTVRKVDGVLKDIACRYCGQPYYFFGDGQRVKGHVDESK